MANCGDMALEEVTKVLSCISIARAIENGMVLILNGITAIIIRIKGIELLRRQAWVDDPVGTHGACSILSVKLPVAASLYVEPVRTCAELCYDSPQMFVARKARCRQDGQAKTKVLSGSSRSMLLQCEMMVCAAHASWKAHATLRSFSLHEF
jgi:hypothetical protein